MQQSLYNALTLAEYLGRPDIGVHSGEANPRYHSYGDFERRAYGQWGDDTPPVWPFGYAPTMNPAEPPARQWIPQCAQAAPGEISAVALGPLTNFAAAFDEQPATASNLSQLYFAGGTFDEFGAPSGNITPEAEFNVWVDPEALETVISSGIRLTIIPLHLMRRMNFDEQDAARISAIDTRVGRFYGTVLDQLEKAGQPTGLAGGDVLGVAAVLWPELFTFRSALVSVDCSAGDHYGRTSLRPSDGVSSTTVAIECDIDEIRRRYLGTIGAPSDKIVVNADENAV